MIRSGCCMTCGGIFCRITEKLYREEMERRT